ncbi:MAG: hypothetical protein K2N78_01255 [Oscillospiraceae bacterium]|nr:hypothetical protein [Oscillospiraceae bacterium]
MRNFFYRVSSALARFMYGRNGNDQLNLALLTGYVLVLLLQTLLGRIMIARTVLEAVSLALAVVILFRAFSKNLSKRRAENAKFLNWWYPVKNRIAGARSRSQDKEHKYFTCKNCKTLCRVPAGKGKIEITCPKCGGKIIGKS